MSNTTVEMFQGLEKHRLVDDASGGRGFGCAAGWIDPSKCPSVNPPPRCNGVFWTGMRTHVVNCNCLSLCVCFAVFQCGRICKRCVLTGGCTGDVTDHHNYPLPQVPYDMDYLPTMRP